MQRRIECVLQDKVLQFIFEQKVLRLWIQMQLHP